MKGESWNQNVKIAKEQFKCIQIEYEVIHSKAGINFVS